VATTYYHPGLYIQEVPSARSVQGASTSVAAFVGVTQSGPVATPTLVTSWNDYTRQFGGLVWYGYVSWAVFEFFNEGGSACYVVRAADTAYGVPAAAKGSPITATAVTPGTWGNNLKIAVTDGSGQASGKNPSPVFNFLVVVDAGLIDTVYTSANLTDQSLLLLQSFVVMNNLPRKTISGSDCYVLEAFNGFTGANLDVPQGAASSYFMARVNANSMFIRVVSSGTARPGNTVTPLAAGTQTTYNLVAGVQTLQKIQGVSLLAVPDTVTATDASGKPSQKQQATLINQSLAFCESMQSLFYAADPPCGLGVQDILNFKIGTGTGANANATALNSSYGAIYYPWIAVLNPIAGLNVPVPPSGAALGRYAHTDASVGVFKSPAGVNDGALRTATSVATLVTDSDQDLLNPEGINAIRNLIGYGNVIYGARTLALGTEWTYVAVRRLFIYVEQSLKQSLQWVVFEPNDQQLWSSVTRDVSAFLNTLWQQGGLFGATAAEAFFVTCDASNNPPETRMLGQLYVDIGLAPVYPAEFVIIRITQKTAGPDSGA
jgi:phage tail sheath protein FI